MDEDLRCRCICANNPYCDCIVDVPVADRSKETLSASLWEHERWVTDADTDEHYCPQCAREIFDDYEEGDYND